MFAIISGMGGLWLLVMLCIAGLVCAFLYFISAVRATLASHEVTLSLMEKDMKPSLVRLEEKIDRVLLMEAAHAIAVGLSPLLPTIHKPIVESREKFPPDIRTSRE